MRITGIRIARMEHPLDPPFLAAWDPVPRRSFAATLVRVETDEGVAGIGSGDTMDGFEAYAHLFIGQDPLRIARHVRALETISFHAGRYWPLEAALWALDRSTTFEEGCLAAVNLGGDADTTGAVYGQIAGASYGERGIPERWRERVWEGERIGEVAERLAK